MAFLLGPQQVGQKWQIEGKENANQNGLCSMGLASVDLERLYMIVVSASSGNVVYSYFHKR